MARINIEETLFADPRFTKLILKTGCEARALGALVYAFKMAQRFWVPGQLPIPAVHFRSIPFNEELLSVGLAHATDNNESYYISGSQDQFKWLIQRSLAGRENKGKKRERKQTKVNDSNRLESSYSFSSSSSGSFSDSETLKKTKIEEKPSGSVLQTAAVWEAYSNAYFQTYGTNPVRNARSNALIKQITQRLGVAAPMVTLFFLGHRDAFYVKAMHPLTLLLRDAEKLHTEWSVGRKMTGSVARRNELAENNSEAVATAMRMMREKGYEQHE